MPRSNEWPSTRRKKDGSPRTTNIGTSAGNKVSGVRRQDYNAGLNARAAEKRIRQGKATDDDKALKRYLEGVNATGSITGQAKPTGSRTGSATRRRMG